MGTTPLLAIPYTNPDDPVTGYPAQDKAKADRLELLIKPVWGSYLRTANQSIATATTTNVIGTQMAMEGGFVLNAGTGEVTVPLDGLYLLNGWATFLANATGVRLFYWMRNTVSQIRTQGVPLSGSSTTTNCIKFVRLVAGDKLAFQVHQTSGAGLALDGTNAATGYEITRIAP